MKIPPLKVSIPVFAAICRVPQKLPMAEFRSLMPSLTFCMTALASVPQRRPQRHFVYERQHDHPWAARRRLFSRLPVSHWMTGKIKLPKHHLRPFQYRCRRCKARYQNLIPTRPLRTPDQQRFSEELFWRDLKDQIGFELLDSSAEFVSPRTVRSRLSLERSDMPQSNSPVNLNCKWSS